MAGSARVTLSPAAVSGLRLASGLSRLVVRGPGEGVARAIGVALAGLADAGAPDSDGGRALTAAELVAIVDRLVVELGDLRAALVAGEQ